MQNAIFAIPGPQQTSKLFTDASNHSYSGILHQAQDKELDQLILIAYFSGSFNHTQQLWNVTQQRMATLCTNLLINFHFTSHGQSASCIVTINLWLCS